MIYNAAVGCPIFAENGTMVYYHEPRN